MKEIKLNSLDDIIYMNNEKELSMFRGYTTIKNRDMNGNDYEILGDQQDYTMFSKNGNNYIYVSEKYLLEKLLTGHINAIKNRDIYDHGYQENRLIPEGFYEECEENHIDMTIEWFREYVEDIFDNYFITC